MPEVHRQSEIVVNKLLQTFAIRLLCESDKNILKSGETNLEGYRKVEPGAVNERESYNNR